MSTDTRSPAVAADLGPILKAAVSLHRRGELQQAHALYRDILRKSPDHPQALCGLGACLAQGGHLDAAIDVLQQAVAHSANAQDAGYAAANLGNALQDAGRPEDALQAFFYAQDRLPSHPDLYVNAGNALRALGRRDEAMASYDRAAAIAVDHARARIGRGVLHDEAGRHEAARVEFEAATRAAPADPLAHFNHGTVLHKLGNLPAAAAALERALQLRPTHAEANFNLGLVYKDLGRPDSALRCMDDALAVRPDFVDAHVSRGHLLQAQSQFAPALESYERALRLRPDDGGVLLTRADALLALGRHAEAAESYRLGLALEPDHADAAMAHMSKAICHLLLGDYAQGLPEFEWRWGDTRIHPPHRYAVDRLWLGHQDPAGATLLLHSEQGYGDILQFCRYAPLLARRGARVIVEVPAPLHPLLQSLEGVAEVREPTREMPIYDLHTPMLTLPLACATRLDTIPSEAPYLAPPRSALAEWSQRLPPGGGRRIGIAWSGNPKHGNDARRSIGLERLAPLLSEASHASVQWISLHPELGDEDRRRAAALGVHDHGAHLVDFAQTAALMHHLDLVITVDTAVAHLAGALARPVWILLPHVPDWRWLLDRSDSPWYPSARLFRQPADGDWDTVLTEVSAALRERLLSQETPSPTLWERGDWAVTRNCTALRT